MTQDKKYVVMQQMSKPNEKGEVKRSLALNRDTGEVRKFDTYDEAVDWYAEFMYKNAGVEERFPGEECKTREAIKVLIGTGFIQIALLCDDEISFLI